MNHQDKVKSRIYWQYKNSPKLIQLLMSLPSIAQSTIEDQLAKVKAMLDIDYAEGEQLDICGRIVGYLSRPAAKIYPSCVFAPVNDDLFRVLIKAKIYRNNSIATVDEVKTAADYILDTETRCLDGQDMTMRMIWFSHDVSIPVQQLVRDYDLIPRPQGVGTREHRVITYKPFGFGPYYSNFRAPFWHGDGLHLYYSVHFQFSFDNEAGILNGKLISEDVVISDLDVKLTITDENGDEKTVFVVTDENGEFSVQMEKTGRYTAVAQTQIITPDCAQAIVTSDPYNFRWHIYVTSITASVATMELLRGESATFTVEILPNNATNKEFSVQLSDGLLADIEIDGNQVTVFGRKKGVGEIIITSLDTGMVATVPLQVSLGAETEFVMRIDSLSRALFFLENINENFTIDYGDGVASRDYTIAGISGNTGYVYADRELTVGQEYTLLVKGANTMRFYASASGGVAFNPLLEIKRITSDRPSIMSFAQNHTQLRKVHEGAFDEVEECTDFRHVFSGCSGLTELPRGLLDKAVNAIEFDSFCYTCTGLTSIPEGLFKETVKARTFSLAFYGCSRLVNIPDELCAGLVNAVSFFGLFRGCTSLVRPGDRLFNGCSSATTFGYVFYGCTGLQALGINTFSGCTSANDFTFTFYGCSKLSVIDASLLSDVPGGTFNYMFQNCTSLAEIPQGLFSDCINSTSFGSTFRGCSALLNVPEGLFDGLTKVTTFSNCFNGCTSLINVGDYVFNQCANNLSFDYIFNGCPALTAVGKNIFQGCYSVTTYLNAFTSCSLLENMPYFTDSNNVLTFANAFSGCAALKSIDENAFINKKLVTTFASVFTGCLSLKSIPEGVFKGCSANTTFNYAFKDCINIETIEGNIFEGCGKVTNIQYLFSGCSSIQTLPDYLFDSFVQVTSATMRIFENCTSLVEVPESLLVGMPNATTFNGLFYGCSSLVIVPEGIFNNNTKLVTATYIFYGCASLEEIPEKLFANNDLITAFTYTFESAGLKSIPSGLFANNVNAVTFSNAFYGCSNLQSVPGDLFEYNVAATTFSFLFRSCIALEFVGEGIFDNTSVYSLNYAFAGCSSLSGNINDIMPLASYSRLANTAHLYLDCVNVTGEGIKLIDSMPLVVAANNRIGTFRNCVSLADYESIPSEWK